MADGRDILIGKDGDEIPTMSAKELERKRIEQDVAAFLARGGQIQVIPLGVSRLYAGEGKQTAHRWGSMSIVTPA